MEHVNNLKSLFQSDIVRVDVTKSHAYMIQYFGRMHGEPTLENVENSQQGGEGSTPMNKYDFNFVKPYVKRKCEYTKHQPIPDTWKLDLKLYKHLATKMSEAVSMGNELEFSSKAFFRQMVIEDTRMFKVDYTREYYQFTCSPELANDVGTKKYIQINQITPNDMSSVTFGRGYSLLKLPMSPIIVRIDRPYDDDGDNVRVTGKLRLFHKNYDYNHLTDVSASFSYETEFPQIVADVFKKKSMKISSMLRLANKIYRIRSYYVYLTYRNTVYRFRLAFRQILHYVSNNNRNMSDITVSYSDYELDVECEDLIESHVFAELALTCLDYIAYQYMLYKRHIRDLSFAGPIWETYKTRLNPDIIEVFTTATCKEAAVKWKYPPKIEKNEYDDLVLYAGLSKIVKLNPNIENKFYENPNIVEMFNFFKN